MQSFLSNGSLGRDALIAAALVVALGGGTMACGGDDNAPPANNAGSGDGDTSVAPGDGDTAMPGDGDTAMPGDGDTAMPGDGDTAMPGDGDSMPMGTYEGYKACDPATRLGTFEVGLERPQTENAMPATVVSGRIYIRNDPGAVPNVLMSEGDCMLVEAPNFMCSQTCIVGTVCGEQGECVPYTGLDMGEVRLSGLKDGPLTLTSRQTGRYTTTEALSYPGFDEGAPLFLTAAGAEGPALSLVAEGVAPLAVDGDSVPIESGKASTITWAPAAQPDRSRVTFSLSVALHGGDAPGIECDTADDGSLEIPEPLITAMLGYNYSGFPAVDIRRHTSAAFEGADGCVNFQAYSLVIRHPVEIPGLSSCSGDTDCPDGQSCNAELFCE